MATIKSFTDIPQSQVLSKILSLETADMYYTPPLIKGHTDYIPHLKRKFPIDWDIEQAIPCWSLASLIGALPPIEGFRPIIDLDINLIRYEGKYRDELCFNGNNLVDACVAMIEKLHEREML